MVNAKTSIPGFLFGWSIDRWHILRIYTIGLKERYSELNRIPFRVIPAKAGIHVVIKAFSGFPLRGNEKFLRWSSSKISIYHQKVAMYWTWHLEISQLFNPKLWSLIPNLIFIGRGWNIPYEHFTIPPMGRLDCIFLHVPKLTITTGRSIISSGSTSSPLGFWVWPIFSNVIIFPPKSSHLGVEWMRITIFLSFKYIQEKNPRIIAIDLHWHHQSYDVIEVVKKVKPPSLHLCPSRRFYGQFFPWRDYEELRRSWWGHPWWSRGSDFGIGRYAPEGERGSFFRSQSHLEKKGENSYQTPSPTSPLRKSWTISPSPTSRYWKIISPISVISVSLSM